MVKGQKKEKYLESDNIEIWLLTAQERTNQKKYRDAISILNEILNKFPGEEILSVNYNIGYNYYKLRNNDEATSYFNRVISLFENTQLDIKAIQENRKYVILAGLILDRIEEDKKARRDPYHVQEDIENFRKNRPQRPKRD
jgi:outer membrane protein assembly factor BamD (BamD/ComL family)